MRDLLELVSTTSDAVWAVDPGQRIVLWNAGAEQVLGYSTDEVLGRACFEVTCGRAESGAPICTLECASVLSARRGGPVPTRDMQVRTKAGRRTWVSVTTLLVPSRWRSLPLLVHLARDVDRRKALERLAEDRLAGLKPAESGDPMETSAGWLRLTERELEVLRLLAGGASTRRIAQVLGITVTTARNHVQRILEKLGVHSRLEAVAVAARWGLVTT